MTTSSSLNLSFLGLTGESRMELDARFRPAGMTGKQQWRFKKRQFNYETLEALAKVFFCGSTSSPRTEKLNNLNLSPFTLSLSKGKLRTFARSSLNNTIL